MKRLLSYDKVSVITLRDLRVVLEFLEHARHERDNETRHIIYEAGIRVVKDYADAH